jgi:hypothetical protein
VGVTANVRTGADYVTAFVDVSSSPSFAASDGGQLYCPSLAYILGHEFGHVLAPDALHSATGLFSIQASDGIAAAAYIDADSLEAVCADAPCSEFNVETEGN